MSVEVKGEYLNMAKISDGVKKLRKNWTSSWTVLSRDHLLFYKDSKQEAAAKAGSKVDGVDLRGAAIEWTTEKSSRKNVFQVKPAHTHTYTHTHKHHTHAHTRTRINTTHTHKHHTHTHA
ncbi:hypothetical protein LDENG_00094070 [Lucifuga dentata]|nr:hypothetical protein LDENG_00094070 [Lucifuga dentata]